MLSAPVETVCPLCSTTVFVFPRALVDGLPADVAETVRMNMELFVSQDEERYAIAWDSGLFACPDCGADVYAMPFSLN